MPKRRTLTLTDEQRGELLLCRDRHKLPYMRERAAALLFIASGSAPAVVARENLWRSRDPDTLSSWLDRYHAHGLGFGCSSLQGAGARLLFPPLYQTKEEAKEALAHLIRRDPRQLGVERTRWHLPSLLAQLPSFHVKGTSSLWHLLDRLGIRWLRGRAQVQSPDPLSQAKRDDIDQLNQQVRRSEGKQVLLYLDECSSERHPTLCSRLCAQWRASAG